MVNNPLHLLYFGYSISDIKGIVGYVLLPSPSHSDLFFKYMTITLMLSWLFLLALESQKMRGKVPSIRQFLQFVGRFLGVF